MSIFRYLVPVLLCTLLLVLSGCDRREELPAVEQPAPPPAPQGRIIALGDSLTAGLGVAETSAWPALLAEKLRQNGFDWQVINAGISGETSSGALARIKWILAQAPDIVILETGPNDGLRGVPVELIQTNVLEAVRMLQAKKVTVVLAGMQIVQNLGEKYTGEFAAIYPAIARETGCMLIPFLLQDVAGEPDLNQEDTIHPNEKGHRIIAETVYPFILQAIQK